MYLFVKRTNNVMHSLLVKTVIIITVIIHYKRNSIKKHENVSLLVCYVYSI